MARGRVRLNSPGIAEAAKSTEMHRAIQALAERVAANIDAQGLTATSPGNSSPAKLHAEVEMTTTDRARASVIVKHPAALAMQAKHGALTKAAAEAGLKVKSRKRPGAATS